uniref:ShKT domain-containing protein n=1 Tax=Syphacia muris TaxID=451379 RepID=A0A0N5AAP8_9BILA
MVKNKTPCCLDRLSTISCQRLQLFNPSLFLYNCIHNADFAFVQCCKTCFTQRNSHIMDLDYKKISENLLTNKASAICYDRRDKEWCESMRLEYARLGCSSMPFAFRVCRKSCGYCSTINKAADVVYNFSIAIDYRRCSNKEQAFATEISQPFILPTLVHHS